MSDSERIEEMATAIEDLLYMGAIRLEGEKATASPQFSHVAANIMESMNLKATGRDEVMKIMYYSLLIYMNENLRLPKSLTMALGNDMENNRESMESGNIINTYVTILSEIWLQNSSK